MANSFVKATQVVAQALGLLERAVVLPNVVLRDSADRFTGAAGDTISIKVPAYMAARTRTLRAGTPVIIDDFAESKVDVKLDTDVYKAVAATDEEMTLDIVDFGEQVMTPVIHSVARGLEDAVAARIGSSSYATTLELLDSDPYATFVDARKALNLANVPQDQRYVLVGANLEAKLLKSSRFTAQIGGDAVASSAMQDAVLGRMAGFTFLTGANALNPSEAYAFHKSAFVCASRAPVLPAGAAWGASQSYAGLTMRALRDYDFVNTRDRLLVDAYVGTAAVTDLGSVDAQGRFTPDPLGAGAASAITATAASDLVNLTAHGFPIGTAVVFSGLTGGAGLVAGTTYYVAASGLTANAFKVAATPNGTAIDITTDASAGTVVKTNTLVRAVKIVDLV